MTSLLYKVLSISILLNLLVFNYVAALAGANGIELSMSKDISSSARVFSIGPETGYVYHYGKATVVIAVVNPNVLFSYRNVNVVLESNFGVFLELSRAFHEQSSISVADLYGRLNPLRERLEASGLSNVDLRVEGLEYVVNLSGKPIDKVAEAVGEVFGDLNETIIVLDKGLFDLRQLYTRSGVISLFNNPDVGSDFRRSVNEVAHSLSEDLVNSSCFCYMGVIGLGLSFDDFPSPILLDISIPASYEKCRATIERHVVELADSIRKYIPEDIPLYIDLYETSPSYCGIEFQPLPVSTVALGSVANASTPKLGGGQGDLVLEPQGGYSLLYLAIIALIPVLGATAYLAVKRFRK
jgi:hypothetical protein